MNIATSTHWFFVFGTRPISIEILRHSLHTDGVKRFECTQGRSREPETSVWEHAHTTMLAFDRAGAVSHRSRLFQAGKEHTPQTVAGRLSEADRYPTRWTDSPANLCCCAHPSRAPAWASLRPRSPRPQEDRSRERAPCAGLSRPPPVLRALRPGPSPARARLLQ